MKITYTVPFLILTALLSFNTSFGLTQTENDALTRTSLTKEVNIGGVIHGSLQDGLSYIPFTDIVDNFAQKDITSLYESGYIKGYEDGLFYPDKGTSRAEFVSLVVRVLNIPVDETILSDFTDINSDLYWFNSIAYKAKELGLIKGQIINNKLFFRPNDLITRGEAISILLKALKVDIPETGTGGFTDADGNYSYVDFTDIPKDSWVSKYAQKANALGIMHGQTTDEPSFIFRPNDSITRAETALILNKARNLK